MEPLTANCPKCDSVCLITETPDLIHFGKIYCPTHGHSWVSNPNKELKPKRKTNSALIYLLPESYQTFCWWCRRDKDYLKSLKPALILQVHHIIEVEYGGLDDVENLVLLCNECHAECHRKRESFNRYPSPVHISTLF
jgi:5-methylcytosine-specific restriction endonuclease McrA